MPAIKRRGNRVQDEDSGSAIVEDIAETGIDALLDGIVDMAGSVAESAVEIVADVAGSAFDGL